MEIKVKKIIKEYWIYGIMIVVFLVIRLSKISLGADLDEAINDIAIGGFASTIVAFMIKVRDDIAIEKRNRALACRVLYGLYSSIAEYLDTFVRCLCIQDDINFSKVSTNTFFSWNELFKNNILLLDDVSKESIINSVERMEKQADKLLNQQDWYISEGILDVNIVRCIDEISRSFVLKEVLLNNTEAVHNLHIMNENLMVCLEKETSLENFLQIEYGFSRNMRSHINVEVLSIEI